MNEVHQTRSSAWVEVFSQVVDVFDADRDAHQVVGDADLPAAVPAAPTRASSSPGWLISVSTPPRLSASAISRTLLSSVRALSSEPSAKEISPPNPRICRLRERVLRMRRQARVVHARHLRMRGQELGQRHRVGVVPLHPDRQRLGAAQHEPRVHRPEDRALGVLHEPQPLDVVVAHGHDDAADAVAVAVEELRGAVDDEIGAELDRPLHVGAGERVVHDDDDVARVRDLARPPRRSVRRSVGLVGVSRNSIFVVGRIAARDRVQVSTCPRR